MVDAIHTTTPGAPLPAPPWRHCGAPRPQLATPTSGATWYATNPCQMAFSGGEVCRALAGAVGAAVDGVDARRQHRGWRVCAFPAAPTEVRGGVPQEAAARVDIGKWDSKSRRTGSSRGAVIRPGRDVFGPALSSVSTALTASPGSGPYASATPAAASSTTRSSLAHFLRREDAS